ncbi:MAG TPA: TPM domain-containing protein [Gammaproteobacteria bacterium]|nr:TPM domain-containing protein [Gammaproteobacteria bacterium]
MKLLNADQQRKVAQAIAEVERHTDAELVAVLAGQSDHYNYIPLLWAALPALLTPTLLLLSPFWLDAKSIALIQLLVFIVAALLLRIPALAIRLIPKSVRYWRASNMARRQFLDNNLHHTRGETGVLIFVSEAERYVEIIADRGINSKVKQEQWESMVSDFVAAVQRGETLQGFLSCIEACGALLSRHAPATAGRNENELSNRLIIVDQ